VTKPGTCSLLPSPRVAEVEASRQALARLSPSPGAAEQEAAKAAGELQQDPHGPTACHYARYSLSQVRPGL